MLDLKQVQTSGALLIINLAVNSYDGLANFFYAHTELYVLHLHNWLIFCHHFDYYVMMQKF